MVPDDDSMDKTCAWLKTLIEWVDQEKRSPIHFAGIGRSFGNRPAAFLELVYLSRGDIPELAMGPVRTAMRQDQLGIFNVHHGNIAPASAVFEGHCVFLDVSRDRRFDLLQKAPLALIADLRDPGRVRRAFEQVMERCRTTAWSPPQYQSAPRIDSRRVNIASQALLKAALLELLGTLMEEAVQSLRAGADAGPAAGLPTGIAEAVALIHREYHQSNLGREHLAKVAAMHPDHFTRSFRRTLSIAPLRYLAQVRIAQASFLLTHTDQQVAQIAHQVGFEDPLHFSRVFRQETGSSPKVYRQKTRE